MYCCDLKAAREIGFDEAFPYVDFTKPLGQRRIGIRRIHPEPGARRQGPQGCP
ncbi:hypothetical protein PV410_26760 [Streptomyces sp. PA03-5A]|nr:hypothetical protein [Streptomyces sp. PA03-5A]